MPTSVVPDRTVPALRESIAEGQARLARDIGELKRDANPVYWAKRVAARARLVRVAETAAVVAAGVVTFVIVHRVRSRHA